MIFFRRTLEERAGLRASRKPLPRQPKDQRHLDDKGFTLLELLVALVILGFILAAISQGTTFGIRASQTQARQSDARAELDAVDRALRSLIEQADPGTLRTAASLKGTPATIALTTELPQAAAIDRHADIAIGVDAAHRLTLRYTPHRHAIPLAPPPPPQETELLTGVDHLEIAYWQPASPGSWQPDWTGKTLPTLIRLRIVFPKTDPRHWPDLIIPTRRTADRN